MVLICCMVYVSVAFLMWGIIYTYVLKHRNFHCMAELKITHKKDGMLIGLHLPIYPIRTYVQLRFHGCTIKACMHMHDSPFTQAKKKKKKDSTHYTSKKKKKKKDSTH